MGDGTRKHGGFLVCAALGSWGSCLYMKLRVDIE